jgi:hypothetical protein
LRFANRRVARTEGFFGFDVTLDSSEKERFLKDLAAKGGIRPVKKTADDEYLVDDDALESDAKPGDDNTFGDLDDADEEAFGPVGDALSAMATSKERFNSASSTPIAADKSMRPTDDDDDDDDEDMFGEVKRGILEHRDEDFEDEQEPHDDADADGEDEVASPVLARVRQARSEFAADININDALVHMCIYTQV